MSAYFRLELKQPSARGVEDQLISSDAVSSLARFEPSAPLLTRQTLFSLDQVQKINIALANGSISSRRKQGHIFNLVQIEKQGRI